MIKQYICFKISATPPEMGEREVSDFLSPPGIKEEKSRHQPKPKALSALLFLYRKRAKQPLDWLE